MEKKKQNNPKTTGDDPSDGEQDILNSALHFLDSVVRKNGRVLDPNNVYEEDRDEEIVAMRGWNLAVTADGKYSLKSPSRGDNLWPKRQPFRSECIASIPFPGLPAWALTTNQNSSPTTHSSPHAGCWCGVYGLKPGVRKVIGTVAGEAYLFGDYVEHDLGFRAQFAYPKNLKWFRCSWCEETYRMNELLIRRNAFNERRNSFVYDVHQSCKSCLGGPHYGNGIEFIPLSHAIEKLEYEYNLEVAR